MNLTITFSYTDFVLAIEVSSDMTVADLKAYALEEAGFDSNPKIMVFYQNKLLNDSESIGEAGIKDNSVLLLGEVPSSGPTDVYTPLSLVANEAALGSVTEPSEYTLDLQIESARQQILYDPELFAQLSEQSPELADALHDSHQFQLAYRKLHQQQLKHKAENDEIDRNFRMALDEMPEVFTTVTMLFANVEVNGIPVKAFIDSGAQTTIMSPECAVKCKLSHLIDKRHRGMAYGVGQATILGRIHLAPIKIGSSYFACSMTVIEGTKIEFLLGLDMLKHHQAILDLKRNRLVMGSEELPFLSESEIPKNLMSPPGSGGSAVASGASIPRDSLNNNVKTVTAKLSGGTHESQNSSHHRPSITNLQPYSTAQPQLDRAAPAPTAPSMLGAGNADVVSRLMSLGFGRIEVLNALKRANGNADIAAAILFGE